MINVNDLKYFKEIARYLNLRKTADALHISQPALTHALKRVEAYFDVQLFERSKKGLKLTAQGEVLVKKVLPIISDIEDLKKRGSEFETRKIKLGVHPSVARYSLPNFLGAFLEQNKNLKLELTHDLSRNITEKVISSDLDIGIVVNPQRHPDLIIHKLCEDVITIWHSKNCKNKNTLIFDPNLAQTQWILRTLAKKKIYFSQYVESSNLEVIESLVNSGAGAGVLPSRTLKNSNCVKFKGAPEFKDEISLIYKSHFRKQQSAQNLIELILHQDL